MDLDLNVNTATKKLSLNVSLEKCAAMVTKSLVENLMGNAAFF